MIFEPTAVAPVTPTRNRRDQPPAGRGSVGYSNLRPLYAFTWEGKRNEIDIFVMIVAQDLVIARNLAASKIKDPVVLRFINEKSATRVNRQFVMACKGSVEYHELEFTR